MMFDDNQIQCPSCQCRLTGLQWKGDIKSIEKSQLRMQALNTACDFELFSEEEGKATLSNAMIIADQIVHYCLTGEHQLLKKE